MDTPFNHEKCVRIRCTHRSSYIDSPHSIWYRYRVDITFTLVDIINCPCFKIFLLTVRSYVLCFLRSLHYCSEEDTPKSCCGLLTLPDATSTVSIRWFIGIVFIAGICSALVGTVLGATRTSGREHLTVALLMIGKSGKV